MTRKTYDVAVVGASLAGCTAARLFAERGLEVALIERRGNPDAHKALCTHFIQPSAVPTIERLDLRPLIEKSGAVRNGLEVWTRWGWIRPPRDVPHGYNIRRRTLDPILRHLAAETPGVELMPGWSAHALLEEDGRIAGVGVRDRAGRTVDIPARLVVAADGRSSKVAQLAGVPERVEPNGRVAYFAYYRDLPLASGTRSLMWMLEPDVAYAFPNDGGVTLLACMPARDRLSAFKDDPEGAFSDFFKGLPDGPSLGGAGRISRIMGTINLRNILRPAAYRGLALVGDAALWTDPLWGVGCGWAFQSAWWLVEETAGTLVGGGDLDRALARYRKKHRKSLYGHHRLICSFSRVRPYNPIERLMFSAAVHDERTARHFHAFGSRLIGVREFLAPGAIGRALWANARRGIGRSGGGPRPATAAARVDRQA
ncbi:MAG: NAD(P)/FAD-dependent oxidoreductase [Actinomycetota bacterium]